MAFTTISSTATDANSPINQNLMDTIRTNLDDLDSRVSTISGSNNYIPAIDGLVDRNAVRRSGVTLHDLDNSVSEIFMDQTAPDTDCFLIEDYSSGGSTMKIVINPTWMNTGDKNFDTTSGWTARNDGANLTTESGAGNFKIGSASLEFDKAGASTFASISYDPNITISDNLHLFFWIKMPSVTNLTHMRARVHSTNTTNYSDFDVTNDISGASFATGWILVKIDLSGTATSSTGSGWNSTQVVTRLEIGVVTSSAGQTYTDMYVDALVLGDSSGKWIQKGDQLSIWNTSTSNEIIIANASTLNQGLVTLAASVANNYTGGTSTTVNRNSITYDTSDQIGDYTAGLSGTITDSQDFRIRRNLDSSLSNVTLGAYAIVKTDLFLKVKTIASATSMTCYANSDVSGEFLNGDTLVHFDTKWHAGKPSFEKTSTAPSLTAGSSYSGGVLTLTVSSTTGIGVGDYITVANLIQGYSSLVAEGSDESFAAMTLDDIEVLSSTESGIQGVDHAYDLGAVVASGSDESDNGSGNIPIRVTAATLSTTTGKTTELGLTGWGTGYLQDSRAVTDYANTHFAGVWRRSWSAGGWFNFATSGYGTSMFFFGGFETGFGWTIRSDAGSTHRLRVGATVDSATWTQPSLDAWHHYVVTHSWSGAASTWNVYLDGVAVLSASSFGDVTDMRTSTAKSGWFTIGSNGTGGNNLNAASIVDDVFLMGSIISAADIARLYNNGVGRPVEINDNQLIYRWSKSSQTGQELSFKGRINLEVDTTDTHFKHFGIIRK